MKALVLVASGVIAGLFSTSALACTPLVATDSVSGATYASGTPEWRRREQGEWLAASDTVVIAQVRAGRMVSGGEIEFRLVPIATLDDAALPAGDLTYVWAPGNTCNGFDIAIADFLVVFVRADQSGWTSVGVTTPELFEHRPADFGRRLRGISRGTTPAPPYESRTPSDAAAPPEGSAR